MKNTTTTTLISLLSSLFIISPCSTLAEENKKHVALTYAKAPVDNPLKGFVPYLANDVTFPHSMEWDYTAVSEVMTAPNQFQWDAFEEKLKKCASRGHQFIARFYLQYPEKKTGVPQYLIDAGLTMHPWENKNPNNHPDFTPDYENPQLRTALKEFITAFGKKYDGDPRLGFVQVGILGLWGEWHNHPHTQWMASKTVQDEILTAYEKSFTKTKLVMRYPTAANDDRRTDNSKRPIGYHDDSFAYATLHTGKRKDAWFYESQLRASNTTEKWKKYPIGGEVRPEVWKCLFDEPSCTPAGQEFPMCVKITHVSWLCNQGVFGGNIKGDARARAIAAAHSLGYEFTITDAMVEKSAGKLLLTIHMKNTGIAPFYYNWPIEIAFCDINRKIMKTFSYDKNISSILPDGGNNIWDFTLDAKTLVSGTYDILIRIPNPLPNGAPLQFANQKQDQLLPGWLGLVKFQK